MTALTNDKCEALRSSLKKMAGDWLSDPDNIAIIESQIDALCNLALEHPSFRRNEPFVKGIEKILDEKSAWIARPSHDVTIAIAVKASAVAAEMHDQLFSKIDDCRQVARFAVEALERRMPDLADPRVEFSQDVGKSTHRAYNALKLVSQDCIEEALSSLST